jgi:hypothetical protein
MAILQSGNDRASAQRVISGTTDTVRIDPHRQRFWVVLVSSIRPRLMDNADEMDTHWVDSPN